MADIFLSYSRRDSDFVRQLQAELTNRGKEVWVDVEGIRDAEMFPDALRRAIEASDAFVFVISPDSVTSQFCEQEISHAVELKKRLVPLALREVPDELIPDEVRFRNWIPVSGDAYSEGVERLLTAVGTDLDWEREHTRLTVKSLEWERAGRDGSFLLRGSDLSSAEQWLAAGANRDPGPTTLEQEYILAARDSASRRQRVLVVASLIIAAVSLGLVVFAVISRNQAIHARNTAKSQARTAKSRALAAESQTQLAVDPERSVLLAADAVRIQATPEAMFALRAALDASPIRFRLPPAGTQTCLPGVDVPEPAVAFDPNGRLLAEGMCAGEVILANARTGQVVRKFRVGGPGGPVAFNRTGSRLAALAQTHTILIDPTSGATLTMGPRPTGATQVTFSPASPIVAISANSGVTLWNFRTHGIARIRFPRGTQVSPSAGLAFSRDGKRLAVGLKSEGDPSQAGLLLYAVASGRLLARKPDETLALAFSPDGRHLAIATATANQQDGRIKLLDAGTLSVERVLYRLPYVLPTAIAFSPDGSQVAFGADDGTIELIPLSPHASPLPLHGEAGTVTEASFDPDGKLVATASDDGTVRVWHTTGETLGTTTTPTPNGYGIGLAPIGHGFTEMAALGDPATGNITVRRWTRVLGRPTSSLVVSPTQSIWSAFLSDDGRLAAVIPAPKGGSQLAPIRIWSIPQRRIVHVVPAVPLPLQQLVAPIFSPDNQSLLFTAGKASARSTSVDTVSIASGKTRLLGATACGSWVSIAVSANSKFAAAGDGCGKVYVWSLSTGRPVGRVVDVSNNPSSLAFSPDASTMAIAAGSAITVANVATGRVIGVLTQNARTVVHVVFSSSGRYLASASLDGIARIWDAHTLRYLRSLVHPDPIFEVAFTPDSRDLITLDDTNVVRLWDACTACEDPAALLSIARHHVTRKLTMIERTEFGVG